MEVTETPTIQGYLRKQGHRVKNWKRRWFSLGADALLTYYEEKGGKMKGQVRTMRGACRRPSRPLVVPPARRGGNKAAAGNGDRGAGQRRCPWHAQ